jgi:membrane protease YdiL (CAAX protease family)
VTETLGHRATQVAQRPYVPFVIGLLIAVLPRVLVPLANALLGSHTFPQRMAVNLVFDWFVVLALALVVTRVEHRPLSSIGWRAPTRRQLGLAAIAGVVLLCLAVVTAAPHGHGVGAHGFARLLALPLPERVALWISSAVSEEVVFRGFLIERTAEVTGALWAGGVVSSLAFAAAHVTYWGAAYAIIAILPGAVIFTLVYLRTRNLPACMVLHLIVDSPILFVRP